MTFNVGDDVAKTSGDYRYRGIVVAAFRKRCGLERYVVENDDGILFIFNERQLELVDRREDEKRGWQLAPKEIQKQIAEITKRHVSTGYGEATDELFMASLSEDIEQLVQSLLTASPSPPAQSGEGQDDRQSRLDDAWIESFDLAQAKIADLTAQLAEARTQTIEECASLVEGHAKFIIGATRERICQSIAELIREAK